ncbi:hypothetical protein BABINDRAFT_166476 [Babjeviella inositovora NRRL Y-12698]|uniref:Uncharacterized protein n=1 Tax=Babjeviella inositovora NRRL Y-12698 TaxID=984486 RepID=A0A1E3QSV7_9ASCO|nr:uncharacterized protein BABINDRAFT_166476 [Babjeviella inositovora NRRL Y-12698]ODQ80102.1 hypothetical protein BABINDRAFT_166476 [Babjeviella inositovora NRRL Y-12698]
MFAGRILSRTCLGYPLRTPLPWGSILNVRPLSITSTTPLVSLSVHARGSPYLIPSLVGIVTRGFASRDFSLIGTISRGYATVAKLTRDQDLAEDPYIPPPPTPKRGKLRRLLHRWGFTIRTFVYKMAPMFIIGYLSLAAIILSYWFFTVKPKQELFQPYATEWPFRVKIRVIRGTQYDVEDYNSTGALKCWLEALSLLYQFEGLGKVNIQARFWDSVPVIPDELLRAKSDEYIDCYVDLLVRSGMGLIMDGDSEEGERLLGRAMEYDGFGNADIKAYVKAREFKKRLNAGPADLQALKREIVASINTLTAAFDYLPQQPLVAEQLETTNFSAYLPESSAQVTSLNYHLQELGRIFTMERNYTKALEVYLTLYRNLNHKFTLLFNPVHVSDGKLTLDYGSMKKFNFCLSDFHNLRVSEEELAILETSIAELLWKLHDERAIVWADDAVRNIRLKRHEGSRGYEVAQVAFQNASAMYEALGVTARAKQLDEERKAMPLMTDLDGCSVLYNKNLGNLKTFMRMRKYWGRSSNTTVAYMHD